jgi:hypothetical protein
LAIIFIVFKGLHSLFVATLIKTTK